MPSSLAADVPPDPLPGDAGLPNGQDDWPVARPRPLGLRLLALLGAFSFVMLGLSSMAPLLQLADPVAPPARQDAPAGGSSGATP